MISKSGRFDPYHQTAEPSKILRCVDPTLEDFEDSDFEGPFKLPSRALNWQKSDISFLILNNLTFGFYFCGDNNPIVLEQLNSEFEVLRVGFATESSTHE